LVTAKKVPIHVGEYIVSASTRLSEDTFRLSVHAPSVSRGVCPGQFFMIKGWNGTDPLLRRPISASDADGENLHFIVRIRGEGTRRIACLRKEDTISLLGPLGRGFAIQEGADRHVMVAGGVGIAPFPLLARALRGEVSEDVVELLYGERGSGHLIDTDVLGLQGIRIALATEDGSAGRHGLVTQLLRERLREWRDSRPAAVYACGPQAMLREVRSIVESLGGLLQVSLESVMGCGLGSCMGCVVRVKGRGEEVYSRVCTEGPVFDGLEVLF